MHPLFAQSAANPAWWAPVIIVVGVIGMGLLMTLSIRGKIARRQAATPSARERIEAVKARQHSVGGRQSVADIATLDRMQDLAALLDNKAARLETLIEQADQRLAELKHTLTEVPPLENDAELMAALEHANHRTEEERHAGSSWPEAADPPTDELSASIYRMADRGLTTVEIAQELDEQVGKVELILALRAQG